MKRRKFLENAMYGLAMPFVVPGFTQFTSTENKIKVGFSAISLEPGMKQNKHGYRYPLEAKCMVITENAKSVIIYSLDLGGLTIDFNLDLQARISRAFNINPDSVLLHCTHTHSVGGEEDLDGFTQLLTKAATEAFANAKPAKVKIAEENVGKSLSVYRRADTGTGLGVQTFWFGYEYAEGDDRPEASALINEMTSRWQGKLGDYRTGEKKVYFDHEVDPWVQTMYFVDMKNKPLGSIVRFSAHPHLTSSLKNYMSDPDFPGRTRTLMEKELGGHCLFLSGGCANLVPKEKVKYKVYDDYAYLGMYFGPISEFNPVSENELLAETTRIGEDIARAAMRALNREKFTDMASFAFAHKPLDVQINLLIPRTEEEANKMKKIFASEYEGYLREKGSIAELRGFANAYNRLEWAPSYLQIFTNEKHRKQGYITLPYSVLRINATPVIFMNSEMPAETMLELRKQFESQKLWLVSLTGGTIAYIPTDKMMDEGGYEGRNTMIVRGTEQKIREHVAGMLG